MSSTPTQSSIQLLESPPSKKQKFEHTPVQKSCHPNSDFSIQQPHTVKPMNTVSHQTLQPSSQKSITQHANSNQHTCLTRLLQSSQQPSSNQGSCVVPERKKSPSPPPFSPISSPPGSPSSPQSLHLSPPKSSPFPTSPPNSSSTTTTKTKFSAKVETPYLHHILTHDSLPPLLHEILPQPYTYYFQSISIGCNLSFSGTFLTNSTSKDSAVKWISEFQENTKTTYRITRGVQSKGKIIMYKTMRHCQHKRKPTKRTLKRLESIRTECTSNFTLKVYNPDTSRNTLHRTHPCEINLTWDHNHSLECTKVLGFRPINSETVEMFHSYFDQGHSPSSALHLHQLNLAIRTG